MMVAWSVGKYQSMALPVLRSAMLWTVRSSLGMRPERSQETDIGNYSPESLRTQARICAFAAHQASTVRVESRILHRSRGSQPDQSWFTWDGQPDPKPVPITPLTW